MICRKLSFLHGVSLLYHDLVEIFLNEGGKLIIGDVAFNTRDELEKCKSESGDDWDDDEIYFVIDELRQFFPNLSFAQKSYCSGIISIQRS